MSWYENAVVYQFYPIGLTGAPHENDFVQEHRILQLVDNGWIEHLERLGVTCVILNPVFQSMTHGYDTIDYNQVDSRLGTKEDLRRVVDAFHEAGIKVLLDAVLNHVGRAFWAFEDVRANREASPYASWFHIDWNGDNRFGDGFYYEGWEGVDELVKLNHHDFGLNDYCMEVIRGWERDYDIDGLRLDVAYCLELGFLEYLRNVANELSEKRGQKFLLLGETMFGDYNRWMGDRACDTVTNYECYKGLWSSMNEQNMYEIAYSIKRQSGDDPWCLYRGAHLLNFVDNHDVPRIATKLEDGRKLRPLYGLLFGMPGVPSIYYGSEWGIEGEQLPGDHELRPAIARPEWNGLTDWICALAHVKRESKALTQGGYRELWVRPSVLVFEREASGERVIVAVNAGADAQEASCDARCTSLRDLITGEERAFEGALSLPPFSCRFWQCC